MTLHYLLDNGWPPPVAVRSKLERAIAERRPTRLESQFSSASAMLDPLHRRLEPAFGSKHRPDERPGDRGRAGLIDGVVEETIMYRRLALQVIQRAFKDICAPACAVGDRESATEFLSGSPMLTHWCSVAAVDPRSVIARATTLQTVRAIPK